MAKLKNKRANLLNSAYAWLYPPILTIVLAEAIKQLIAYLEISWTSSNTWFLYGGLYVIFSLLLKKCVRSSDSESKSIHPAETWPYPGPVAKYGKLVMASAFFGSTFLSLLNPFLLSQQLRLMVGQIGASKRLASRQKSLQYDALKAQYQLPFAGPLLVLGWFITVGTRRKRLIRGMC